MGNENEPINNFELIKKEKKSIWIILAIVFTVFFFIILAMFTGIAVYNTSNDSIISGIFIKGTNVSGLTKPEAIYKLEESLKEKMTDNIYLIHNDFETDISIEQIEAKFDIESAVNKAYEIGREGNIIQNTFKILKVMTSNINIEPILYVNDEQLTYALDDISKKLPDTIINSSYYIDGNNLVITKGKAGNVVNVNEMKNVILDEITNLTYNNKKIDIVTTVKEPDSIDIGAIRNEIYKQPIDAYYTKEPFVVHPHEDGVDLKNSIEEVKAMLQEDKEEYVIPLKITKPQVTTNMIGTEAFPDLISSFSTKYNASNKNRTTNLILASNKVNGTVLMPGEVFSYNTVVGERTIAAGYKEAAIYSNGEVTDGLGGGICQISTTLYNAVVYANLEIVERRNHMFIPSYAGAGRDATVVYGSTDFKFKNNRNYPIKIMSYVDGGIAKFEIFGLRQENEYEVEIKTKITGSIPYSVQYVSRQGVAAGKVIQKGVNGTKSETYKILKQNGQVVSTELLSKDTYKAMNKLIAK